MGLNKMFSPNHREVLVKVLDAGTSQGSYLSSDFGHIGGKGDRASECVMGGNPMLNEHDGRVDLDLTNKGEQVV
jgi:hypothetical protein